MAFYGVNLAPDDCSTSIAPDEAIRSVNYPDLVGNP